MLGQVEVAARGDAFEFFAHQLAFVVAFAEGEFVEDVHGGAGVVGQFLRLLPILDQRGARQADVFVEAKSFLDPILMPHLPAPIGLRLAGMAGTGGVGDAAVNGFDRFVGPDEKLQFHLLELARAEGEIARVDFVAERLADLADAERNLLARDFEHVLELHEDGLRGFGTQIGLVVLAFDRADVGLEHQVERARLGQQAAVFWIVAGGVFDLLGAFAQERGIFNAALLIELLRRLCGRFRAALPGGSKNGKRVLGFLARRAVRRASVEIGNAALRLDLVGAKALLRQQAIDHQVAEGAGVAAGFPDFRMHDDGGFEADDVVAALGHGAPPGFLDVALEFGAERAVIPEAVEAAVDFGGLENESPAFAEGNDFLHQLGGFSVSHKGQKCS